LRTTHDIVVGGGTVKLQHRLFGLLVFVSTGVEDVRFRNEEDENTRDLQWCQSWFLLKDKVSYSGEHEFNPDQHSPLGRLMNPDKLGGDGDDQLTGSEENLVGSDEHASDLERSEFGNIGDQDGLGESNT
jgi:hypothetical protein